MPISIASAPFAADGSDRVLPTRVAAGDVRHEQLAAAARLARSSSRAGRHGRGSARPPPMHVHHLRDVLVAAAGEVDDDRLPCSDRCSRASQAIAWADSRAGMMPSVRASSWKASITSASVTFGYSARPIDARYECSGPTPGIVEPGRDRHRLFDLSVLVLHQVAAHAVHDTRARRVPPPPHPPARHRRAAVGVDEAGEDADRVRTAADACDHDVGVGPGASPGIAGAPRRRSPGGTGAPSTDTGVGPSPSRGSSACRRPSPPSRARPR